MASMTALGGMFMTFVVLAATTTAAQQVIASGASHRQMMLSPATRAGGPDPHVDWRRSRALGAPFAGSLHNGTKLPTQGPHFVTWNFKAHHSPSPSWRRWGTDRLIRVILRVTDAYARANPTAPRIVIGDLSRRRGGNFASSHASHQNGLDVDIYYPRLDRRERAPFTVAQIDRRLAQDLVDRFARAGAQFVFVGPNTGLHGQRGTVMVWPAHDNHMHVRLLPG